MSTTIFPLPLTVFERYMFLDDRAGNSMTFPLTVLFQGRFDKTALEEAYDEARRIHPLFLCTISPDGKSWIYASKTDGIVWLEERPEVLPWKEPAIDITRFPGLKFTVWQGEHDGQCEVRFDFLFHHCVSDGMGFMQFLDTLFVCYCRKTGTEIPEKKYDALRLSRRDVFDLEKPSDPLPWYRLLWATIVETVRWMRSRPVPLVSKTNVAATPENETKTELIAQKIGEENVVFESKRWQRSGFVYTTLSPDATSRILSECKKRKQTVGDYLLARMFLSIADSSRFATAIHGKESRLLTGEDLLRIGVVCNMRGRDSETIPACNIISYVFPSRKKGDCRDDAEFHQKVTEELYVIKKWHIGSMFLDGLTFFSRFPGVLSRIIRNESCLASAMLSSLSRLEAIFSPSLSRDAEGKVMIGDAVLFDFHQAAPCRKKTNLSVTTFSYAGTFRIHVRYDADAISRQDACDWLAAWIERLVVRDKI